MVTFWPSIWTLDTPNLVAIGGVTPILTVPRQGGRDFCDRLYSPALFDSVGYYGSLVGRDMRERPGQPTGSFDYQPITFVVALRQAQGERERQAQGE